MKTIYLLGCILQFAVAPGAQAQRLTTDDPNFTPLSQLADSIGWYRANDTNAWTIGDSAADSQTAQCMDTLNKLRAAGVPDTRTVEIRWEGPDLKPGMHTLAEIRGSCERVAKLGKIKDFEKWAILSMQAGTNVRSGADFYRMCLQSYDKVVKAGVSPAERVPERVIGGTQWSGSIEELRNKYCAAGMAQAKEKTAAGEAPYRKEMKADKLRIALKYGSVFLPGGAGTSDAHRMAAATVWFLDLSPPRRCVDGRQVHTIRRYQFGGDQLVKTTEHDYCGGAPRSAFQ
jgi:hypothetical protein